MERVLLTYGSVIVVLFIAGSGLGWGDSGSRLRKFQQLYDNRKWAW